MFIDIWCVCCRQRECSGDSGVAGVVGGRLWGQEPCPKDCYPWVRLPCPYPRVRPAIAFQSLLLFLGFNSIWKCLVLLMRLHLISSKAKILLLLYWISLYRGKVGLDVAEAQHLMEGLDWQGAVKDISASVNWLKANGSPKVIVVYLCFA